MSRGLAVAGAALVALVGVLSTAPGAHGLATAGSSASSGEVAVVLDRARVEAGPGEKVRFTSTLTNEGRQDLTGLVAHLSILTTDPGVYVDPEDWSAARTQYADPIPAGGSTELSWEVQAVTSGPILLSVTVTDTARGTSDVSPPLQMVVGGQRVVDATGAGTFVLWPPAAALAILGATLLRRRRHR